MARWGDNAIGDWMLGVFLVIRAILLEMY